MDLYFGLGFEQTIRMHLDKLMDAALLQCNAAHGATWAHASITALHYAPPE